MIGTGGVVAGFGGAWPYGERTVLVATHRPLEPARPEVRAIGGDISALVAAAREAAGKKDACLDGGDLIRQAMDAKLVDDLIVTMVPTVLGEGRALFAGVTKRHTLEFVGNYKFGPGMLQLHCRPVR